MNDRLMMSILVKRGAEKEWTNEVEDPARAEALNWVYNELVAMGSDYVDDTKALSMTSEEMDDASKCHGMCVTEECWKNKIFDRLTKKLTRDAFPDVSFAQRMIIVAATALAAAEARIRIDS